MTPSSSSAPTRSRSTRSSGHGPSPPARPAGSPGRPAVRQELDRGDRHRDAVLAGVHLVGVDDPLVGDDVPELGVVGVHGPVRRPVAPEFVAPDPEVESVPGPEGIGRPGEPAGLAGGLGPCPEDRVDRDRVGALDDEGVMGDGGQGHASSSVVGWSSRTAPNRSRRTSQPARRSAIHCSAAVRVARSIRHTRVLPTFSVVTNPQASRTWTCWSTAASDMASGSASWLTEADPPASRSTMVRRLLSASAWNVRSRSIVPSSMYLTICPGPSNSQVATSVFCQVAVSAGERWPAWRSFDGTTARVDPSPWSPPTPRSADVRRTGIRARTRQSPPRSGGLCLKNPGGVLLSQGATPQVPSALTGLTAVFGMGTGVSLSPWPPETVRPRAEVRDPGQGSTSRPGVTPKGHPERSIASTSKFPSPRPISCLLYTSPSP